jgi:CspA family cold shock protein
MATGKVKFFERKRCFGFIVDDETQKDIYVHISGLADRKLRENDEVTFDIEIVNDGKSKKAVNVKKITKSKQKLKIILI